MGEPVQRKARRSLGRRKEDWSGERRAPPGAAPGTIVADPAAPAPVVRVIAYSEAQIVEEQVADLDRIAFFLEKWPVVWVNVDGLGDARTVDRIGAIFGLHRLALEDVVNVHQRPKVEPYQDHVYVVARVPTLSDRIVTEQISLFFGRNWLLSFQEWEGDSFDPVRRRIREGTGRMRASGPDYLAYALLDAIVDNYFPILEREGERLEELESEIFETPGRNSLTEVHRIKRDLLTLRRAVWPQRDALSSLMRDPSDLVTEETRIHLRDGYDHTVQIMDLLESWRETTSSLVEGYMSSVSNRMNEVMKVLTVIATIFIPLTFLTGVYGMNFEWMPELGWRWGYPVLWGIMALLVILLLGFFARKGWLHMDLTGAPKKDPEGRDDT